MSLRPLRGPELDRERPLLLDPCRDAPEEHLLCKGAVSLAVYALQRPILVQARLTRQLLIRGQMDVVQREAGRLDDDPGYLAEILDEEVSKLRRFCCDGEPYTQMARQMIEPFMARLLQ